MMYKNSFSHCFSYSMGVFGQSPMGNEDQFSFYSPFFLPDGSHTEAYLFAPEANLLTLENVIYGQNALYSLIQNGLNACEDGKFEGYKT